MGEDIRKQLPKESKDFDDVNVQWKNIMTKTNRDKNAQRATHQESACRDSLLMFTGLLLSD